MDNLDEFTICILWFVVLACIASIAGFLAEYFGPEIEEFLKGRF